MILLLFSFDATVLCFLRLLLENSKKGGPLALCSLVDLVE